MTLRSSFFALAAIFTLGVVLQAQAGNLSASFGDTFASLTTPDGGGSQIDLPISFDDPTVDYTVTDFGDGVATTLVADPADAANMVASTVKGTAAPDWGGTTMSTPAGLATAIPFTATETMMNVRVWSPDAGTPVLLKVEDATDGTRSVETLATTTVADGWETLVFDFSSERTGTAALDLTFTYDKASIFFNFGTTGATAGEKTYLWDDVAFGGGGGGGGLSQVDLPISFDDPTVDYTVTDFGDGVATTLVADPADAANMVASTVKGTAAPEWGGTTMSTPAGLATAIPFTATETMMNVRVWSPDAGTPVLLKVEDATDGTRSVETLATTTVADGWETLVFDFSSERTGTAALDLTFTYDKASIFFNFGTTGATAGEKTYLWDDVAFGGGGGGGGIALPVTFEEMIDYELQGFGGNTSQVVVDPTDAANKVVETVRGTDAMTWAGTTVANVSGFTAPIPFAADATTMSVRVWSPTAGTPVLFKVEDHTDGGISSEVQVSTTMAGAWETLVFDFAGGSPALDFANSYTKASVFFNFGAAAPAAPVTYYWDDVAFGGSTGGGLSQVDLPISFDDPTVDYTVTDFGDGVATTLVADPADAANMVASTVKGTAAPDWGGTTMSTPAGLATAIPFTATETTLSARVWSPDAGTPVLLKVEDATDGTRSVETLATTTVADGWETLVFDFSSERTGTAALDLTFTYDKASIFFNFGTTGATAGEKTYLWDDVAFGGGGGGGGIALPVTFEEMIDYELQGFGGNTSQVVVDPTDAANKVVETVRGTDAMTWAGTTVANVSGFTAPIPFAADATTMSVRVWSPTAGTPVLFKVEDHTDGGISSEVQVSTTMAGAWETLVFDFAGGSPALDFANSYTKASVFFNFGAAAPAAPVTYYWDDVAFGGDPPPSNEIALPVTFEEMIDYELTDFGGNVSQLIPDPTDATNTVAETIRGIDAPLWAGTTVAEVSGFTEPLPFADGATTMNVRVWTPVAGTPVRLKVEKVGDPTISVEAEVNSTQNGAWEVLTFDFANEVDGTAPVNFANTYTKASIFFNFGQEGATETTTYYWDDLAFGEYIPGVAIEDGTSLPEVVALDQNFPNPFTGATSFRIALPTAGNVSVDVFNVLGQRVATVVDGPMEAGTHTVPFNASGLAGGTYFYRLHTGEGTLTKSMVLIR